MSILSTIPESNISIVRRADGKITGERITFTGTGSKSTLRAQGRELGLKGNALTEWVYQQSSGDTAQAARTLGRALFNAALDAGMIPQDALKRTSGNIEFKLIAPAKEPKTKTITCQDPAAMVAAMTPEQKAALLSALMANV